MLDIWKRTALFANIFSCFKPQAERQYRKKWQQWLLSNIHSTNSSFKWKMKILIMMSIFSYSHNVYKSRLLERCHLYQGNRSFTNIVYCGMTCISQFQLDQGRNLWFPPLYRRNTGLTQYKGCMALSFTFICLYQYGPYCGNACGWRHTHVVRSLS